MQLFAAAAGLRSLDRTGAGGRGRRRCMGWRGRGSLISRLLGHSSSRASSMAGTGLAQGMPEPASSTTILSDGNLQDFFFFFTGIFCIHFSR